MLVVRIKTCLYNEKPTENGNFIAAQNFSDSVFGLFGLSLGQTRSKVLLETMKNWLSLKFPFENERIIPLIKLIKTDITISRPNKKYFHDNLVKLVKPFIQKSSKFRFLLPQFSLTSRKERWKY